MSFLREVCFYLFVVYICGQQVLSQTTPKFCETKHFDGIWNNGTQLQVIWRESQSKRWVWTYDTKAQTFVEPPVMESKGMTDNMISQSINCCFHEKT